MLRKILIAAAATAALLAVTQTATAGHTWNGIGLNGIPLNGVSLNGM